MKVAHYQITTPAGTATLKIVGDKIEISGAKALAEQAKKNYSDYIGFTWDLKKEKKE